MASEFGHDDVGGGRRGAARVVFVRDEQVQSIAAIDDILSRCDLTPRLVTAMASMIVMCRSMSTSELR